MGAQLYVTPGGAKEAALDLLLAEELATSPAFADQLARPAFAGAGRPLPDSLPTAVEVRFNVWHEVDDGSHGENDLDVVLRWDDGVERRLLVEDKVWAPLQPRQAERYVARAEACQGAALLVAPRAWLKRQPKAAEIFHASRSIEELATYLEDVPTAEPARRGWRVQLLRALTAPEERGVALDHGPTIEFRDYCIAWLERRGSTAEPMPSSLHTAGQGWLWFRHPRELGFKASSGSVDLYVAPHGSNGTPEELRAALTAHPPPVGFDVATDTSKHRNVVLRRPCPRFVTGEGVPPDTAELDAALDACARITEWFDGGGEDLLRSASARAPSEHAQVD